MAGRFPNPVSASLRIHSTHPDARVARNWLAARLGEAGCSADFSGEVLLAVGEALTNVVRHAYRGEPGHPIDVDFSSSDSGIEVLLHDQAACYSDSRKGALPDPESLSEGGYGLFLIQTIMDEVHRSSRGPVGNTLRMIKYRPREDRKAS